VDDEQKANKKEIKVETLTRLRGGQTPFLAWGYSDLKVQRGEECFIQRMPIKSTGLAEIMEQMAADAPVPPTKKVLVKPDSPEGREARLTHATFMQVFDTTDKDYIERSRKHNVKTTFRIILNGLAVDIEDERENVLVKSNGPGMKSDVTDEDAAITVLKGLGFSTHHFDKMYADITNLTNTEKEAVDLG
jgi:hypothetical protein